MCGVICVILRLVVLIQYRSVHTHTHTDTHTDTRRRHIPRLALLLRGKNELQYHGLAACIKSANDASISCENFVKFSPVTPELTELICER